MVSRETGFYTIEDFFELYKKTILKTRAKSPGTLSLEAAALTVLSFSNPVGLFIIISPDEKTSNSLYTESYGICPDSSYLFPDLEPENDRVPGFVSEGQRYAEEALSVLFSKNGGGRVFTTNSALKSARAPSLCVENKEIVVRRKQKLKMTSVVQFLDRWGYQKTDRVESPLDYTIRGGILDVYLVHSRNPIRIEFFGDEIESIRLFNPRSQITVSPLTEIVLLPRLIKNKKKEETLFSFISFNDSINIYNIENAASGGHRVSLRGPGSPFLPLRSDRVSRDAIKRVVKEKNHVGFFSFTGHRSAADTTSFLPDGYTSKKIRCPLKKGFVLEDPGLVVFGSEDFSGMFSGVVSRWAVSGDPVEQQNEVVDISDLVWGENIVHEEFGVGVYRGIEKTGGNDCVKIKYADGGFVFVPAHSFNRLHRLVGVKEGSVKLSSLKSGSWKRKKDNIKKHARSIAKDLLKTYALRQDSRGFVYQKKGAFYRAVCDSFPFQETKGQGSALSDIDSDMEKDLPMDRMICGDVGYGKTEVALRAAIRVVESGRVVFIMAPTTILANQHYISFGRRLSPLGVHVELLSRFRTKQEQTKIIEALSSGNIDVLVGTHRLISEDVYTENLGLIVIDEEHRFGVKHKEKIKTLRPSVDVLTLTATPIPRTLKQSLVGLKNISTINTPPRSRRPIKTFLHYFDWEKIYNIIKKEAERGGQVYFVNNNIRSLPFLAKKINKRFPDLCTQIAHGKTKSKALEAIMLGFFKNEIEVLCCTTIVGSGLDISNANTIIINNAHRLGLSQLYQLRGRVGRGGRQAYCYMFIPEGLKLEGPSFQRLKALEQNTRLGSGYKIALKDLDIRGAGDLFGTKQSGAVASVGFHMYNKILREALDEERGIKKNISIPIISSDYDSGLPENYVSLVEDRLYFYQSLAMASSTEKIKTIEKELRDRFGAPPSEASFLLETSKIRVLFTNTSLKKLSLLKNNIILNVVSFFPFKSVGDFNSAILNLFKITDKNLSLKMKKNKEMSVSIGGLSAGSSSIKKISNLLESLFLKKDVR
jgi:transcription-repair coupling factor